MILSFYVARIPASGEKKLSENLYSALNNIPVLDRPSQTRLLHAPGKGG